MAYTFTIHDTAFLQDTTFDRLYADSLDDFDSGTVKWRTGLSDAEKKERVYAFLNQGMHDNEKLISINKDDTVCMYIQALIKDNTFIWNNAITGKISNSKAYCSEQTFHEANKTWIQSQGCNAWEVHCIPDCRVDTFFVSISGAGKTVGTFTRTLEDDLCKLRWEY